MRFTIYGEKSGTVVDLSEYYKRPGGSLKWGGGPRLEVTRYGGSNAASAQILGEEYEDITFKITLDDMQSGQRGLAQATARELEALRDEYGLVRLEYEGERWWGFLHVTRDEKRADMVTMDCKIVVLYRVPPDTAAAPVLQPQPLDLSGALEDVLASAAALATSPPAEVSLSLAAAALLEIRKAQNGIAEVLGVVSVIEYYSQLGAVESRRLMSVGLESLASLARAADRIVNTNLATASTVPGVGQVLAGLWQSQTELELRKASVTLRTLITGLAEVAVPSSARTHTVRAGETMIQIARVYYGDGSLWLRIADANAGAGMAPAAGSTLIIPEVL